MLKLDAIWSPDNQQNYFRLLLDAMAHPGQCYSITVIPDEGPAALVVLSTLLDNEVTLSDPHAILCSNDWSMLQVKEALAEQADYIVCDGKQSPIFLPKLGTLPCPEQSATLVLIVKELGSGDLQLHLEGPGIDGNRNLMISGLNSDWLERREDWVSSFPLGVDLIIVDNKQLAAIPRTTKVEML